MGPKAPPMHAPEEAEHLEHGRCTYCLVAEEKVRGALERARHADESRILERRWMIAEENLRRVNDEHKFQILELQHKQQNDFDRFTQRLEQLERKLSEERDLRKAVEEKAASSEAALLSFAETSEQDAVRARLDALESKLNVSESDWNSGELNYRPRQISKNAITMLTNQTQRAQHTGESLDGDKHKAAWQVLRQSLRRHFWRF